MTKEKIIYPATIIIASLILGGSLIIVEFQKQKFTEKQQPANIQAEVQPVKETEEENLEIIEETDDSSEANNNQANNKIIEPAKIVQPVEPNNNYDLEIKNQFRIECEKQVSGYYEDVVVICLNLDTPDDKMTECTSNLLPQFSLTGNNVIDINNCIDYKIANFY